MAPIESSGVGEPVGFPFLPDALEALIATGELERAERLLVPFEQRALELDRAWARATGARCRGLLYAARGELEHAEAEFARALEQHRRLTMPFEEARTLMTLGQLQRRARKPKQARAAIARADEVFEALGARLWADRARAELARTHLRQVPGELTPTERRVAELAAAGGTNRQIAGQLFVSAKTVEANLARVYRKLGIHSRAELGMRMAGELESD
jgi:DNA-binding CsgD family transcriptional regulator